MCVCLFVSVRLINYIFVYYYYYYFLNIFLDYSACFVFVVVWVLFFIVDSQRSTQKIMMKVWKIVFVFSLTNKQHEQNEMIYSSDEDEYEDGESATVTEAKLAKMAEAQAEQAALEERNHLELSTLTAKIEEIDEKLRKLEEKFKDKSKVVEFNGYRDLKPVTATRYAPDGSVIAEETSTISDLKKVELILNLGFIETN